MAPKLAEIPAVAISILLNFLNPKWGKRPFPNGETISVPKIPIYKYDQILPNEYDVGSSGQGRNMLLKSPTPFEKG